MARTETAVKSKAPAAAIVAKGGGGANALERKKCVTHEFRVSFPVLFKAKSAFEGQDEKFSVVALFPKKVDLSAPANGQKRSLRGIVRAAAEEKWGKKEDGGWPKNLRLPFRDGDEKKDTMGYEGMTFVTMTSKLQPGLVDKDLQPILSERDFYAGCWARAEVIAFAYDKAGNKGVGLSLQNVQKLRDDKPFSGRKRAEDVFDAVEDSSDDESSYGGGDDVKEKEDDDDGGF